MSDRPTLQDVANAAGVSYATADRVVNGRGKVAAKSVARVQDAVRALAYTRDVHAANLSRRRVYRFRFLLPQGGNSFFEALAAAVEAERPQRHADRMDLDVVWTRAFDTSSLVAALMRAGEDGVDGVAVVASETPEVQAAMAALRAKGIIALTLVSDVGAGWRDAYVGIDNLAAGRTVGRLMRLAHRNRPAVILPLLGSGQAKDHRERLQGFLDILAAAPDLRILDVAETGDDPHRMERIVTDALAAVPDISGIYSAGAGNEGLIRALARIGPVHRPVVILHELGHPARQGLLDDLVDAVIDQRPAVEVAEAIRLLRVLCDRGPMPPSPEITPAIHVKDNLPAPREDAEGVA